MPNPFLVIILAAVIIRFALDLVANLLNLSAAHLEIPAALEGVYKPEDYRKSQQYLRTTTRFAFVADTFQLLLLLAFWFAHGFNYLDQAVRSWGFASLINGLLYIGILFIGYSLLTLPFSIYATFVIEQRYGFNRTTPRTFVLDRVKGLLLAVVLGGALLAGILGLFEYAGPYAWLYAWLAVTLLSLVMQFVFPTWVMPLFNKFTPLETGELRDAILNYARSVKFPVKNIFVMDSSKRSTKSNAFFTGFGRNKRIVLFDTLIAKHTVSELVAVLAHEVGHYKKKHVLQGMLLGILHTGLIFFLLSVFLASPGLYSAFYVAQPSIYTGLVFFGLLYTPIELFLSIVTQMISRRNESAADRFASETITQPHSLDDALKKLAASNYSNLTPHPFYVFLYYSHPPLLQRVRAIQKHES